MQHTCVAKHPNLAENEVPVPVRVELIELLVQQLTHALDAARHLLHLSFPLSKHAFIIHYFRDNASPVDRRVRVHGTRDSLQLRQGSAHKGMSELAIVTLR